MTFGSKFYAIVFYGTTATACSEYVVVLACGLQASNGHNTACFGSVAPPGWANVFVVVQFEMLEKGVFEHSVHVPMSMPEDAQKKSRTGGNMRRFSRLRCA